MVKPITVDREQFRGMLVTLDGQPAGISGFKNNFATVFQLEGSLSLEFSWLTVSRVVSRGGKFRS